jgi:hypothetical protein
MACPYAHSLGVPGQGFHAARIAGYALNDILGTIGLAAITSYLLRSSFLMNLVAWFVLGEVLHYAFGAQTAFLTTLGINACNVQQPKKDDKGGNQ